MKTELVKISAQEFGLDEAKAQEIESQFLPVIQERDNLLEAYTDVMQKDVSIATCKEARELRLKFVKVRTSTGRIHKVAKAFYLAGGKFVDAWKNRNVTVIQEMETKLEEIETHFERIEAERVEKLNAERYAECLKFTQPELIPQNLGLMDEAVFASYLTGLRVVQEQKIEAERKAEEARIEAEKKAEEERKAKEKADREERERIAAENERLKKEAEEREALAAIERKKAAEERRILEAQIKAKEEAEKAEQERIAKAEKTRLAAERKAKAAPDKVKLIQLADALEAYPFQEVKSEDAQMILNNVRGLLKKTATYIRETTEKI